jgi:tetratricopeptide (TPR) repeat protein
MPFFDTISTIIGLVLLAVFTILSFKVIKDEKRIVIWAAIWFLAFSIPSMLFRSYKADSGYEYFDFRAYTPIMGILIISGCFIKKLMAKISFERIIIFSIPVLLIYSIISFTYLKAFADPISFFTSAIESGSNNAIALNSRGYIYLTGGKIEPAMADFDNAIRISPTLSGPYYNKGSLYYSINDLSKAEHFYSLALKYDTLYPESSVLNENAYINLLVSKKGLGKYEDMITLLKKATKIYPNNDQLHNLFGLAYFYNKDYESAALEYNIAIQLQPGSFIYFNNRGKAKIQLKDIKGALTDFISAIELKPEFIEAYQNRGVAKMIINDYEGAISDLNIVIRLNPSLAEAYYIRGMAYSKLKKQPEAEKDWAQAKKLGFKNVNQSVK